MDTVHCGLLQGVMVRLMLVLAPVMCILAGIGVSATLSTYMKNLDPLFGSKKVEQTKKTGKKSMTELNYPIKHEVTGYNQFCDWSVCVLETSWMI